VFRVISGLIYLIVAVVGLIELIAVEETLYFASFACGVCAGCGVINLHEGFNVLS